MFFLFHLKSDFLAGEHVVSSMRNQLKVVLLMTILASLYLVNE